MPIYEYRCTNAHTFEVLRSMTDEPITACEVCGEPVERVFHPIAVHFKGSGFYNTDYKNKGAEAKAASSEGDGSKSESGESSKSGDSASKSDSSAPSKAEKKPKADAKGSKSSD